MNQVRAALNKLPPGASIKILRRVYTLPTPAARKILKDVTKPRNSHKPWIYKVPANNEWAGCWIGENIRNLDHASLMKRVHDADLVFFYVHGGGFRIGSCTMFMDTYIQWIQILKQQYGMDAIMMSVDYRLAPECKYPGPVEDVVRAYEYLTKTIHVDASKIIVAGDCAGATLALEMLFITHDPSMFEIETDDDSGGPALTELPRPAGAVFSSPIVTDETTSHSWKINVKHDFVTQYTAKIIKKEYFEKSYTEDPNNQILGIAKLETGFKQFLPAQVLMYLGNKEVLRDDSLELAFKAENDGVHWENMIEDCVHDWFVIREVVKDKQMLKRADATFADFCYRAVRGIRRNSSQMRLSTRTPIDPSKILYENPSDNSTTDSEYLSMIRSDVLEIVPEEDEDDDDTTQNTSQKYYEFDQSTDKLQQRTGQQSHQEEEDSSEDSDFESAFEMSSSTLGSKQVASVGTKVAVANRVAKQKPRTVIV